MYKAISICLLTIAAIEHAAGAQVLHMAPEESMPVRVSDRDLTRIAIVGGRIAKVWGQADRVEVEADSDGGQLFIQPKQRTDEEFALYLRDDLGDTYTLLIAPGDRAAETLLIQRREQTRKKDRLPLDAPYARRVKRWMRLLAADKWPDGAVADHSRHRRDWRSGVTVSRVLKATADGWQGERHLLTNHSGEELSLSEQDFADFGKDVLAVHVENRFVPAGGRTAVYLLRRQQ